MPIFKTGWEWVTAVKTFTAQRSSCDSKILPDCLTDHEIDKNLATSCY